MIALLQTSQMAFLESAVSGIGIRHLANF